MPAIMDVPHRGAGGAARASDSPAFNILFRRLVRHACSLGPRVVGKILLWLVPDRGALLREFRCYVRFDPAFIRTIGAADWVELRALVRKAGP
jgi:hypothetical protein